LEEIGELWFF